MPRGSGGVNGGQEGGARRKGAGWDLGAPCGPQKGWRKVLKGTSNQAPCFFFVPWSHKIITHSFIVTLFYGLIF